MTNETCPIEVQRGDVWHARWEPCGKPVKGTDSNGRGVCGVHLRADKNAVAQAEKRHAFNVRRDAVSAALGNIYVGRWAADDASVTISLADLEQALRDKGLLP